MGIIKISKVVNILLVGIMMIAILLCCSNQVQAAQSEDYTYTVTAGKAQITKYTGAGEVATIPSILGGAPVTSIGDYAFTYSKGLTTISIPQGVTSIGDYAFANCNDLITINIPQGITSISEGTFAYCTRLPAIRIPEGVTSIGTEAFAYCTRLPTINIPKGVTSIGNSAFSNCGSLTIINLPQKLININDSAFSDCRGLTSISIPQGVIIIGDYVFSGCEGLTSITFNSSLTSIMSTQSRYTIPETTKIIGYDPSTAKDYALKYDRKFESLGFPPIIPDTTGMIEIDTDLSIVKSDKIWTIKLNGLVNEASIKDEIYITNSQGLGKQVPTCTVTTVNGVSQIKVTPVNAYTPGDYILWVKDIKSGKGTRLKSQVYLRFTVQ